MQYFDCFVYPVPLKARACISVVSSWSTDIFGVCCSWFRLKWGWWGERGLQFEPQWGKDGIQNHGLTKRWSGTCQQRYNNCWKGKVLLGQSLLLTLQCSLFPPTFSPLIVPLCSSVYGKTETGTDLLQDLWFFSGSYLVEPESFSCVCRSSVFSQMLSLTMQLVGN